MKFDSLTHARNYASASCQEVVIYKDKLLDISKYKHMHPGKPLNFNYIKLKLK